MLKNAPTISIKCYEDVPKNVEYSFKVVTHQPVSCQASIEGGEWLTNFIKW